MPRNAQHESTILQRARLVIFSTTSRTATSHSTPGSSPDPHRALQFPALLVELLALAAELVLLLAKLGEPGLARRVVDRRWWAGLERRPFLHLRFE